MPAIKITLKRLIELFGKSVNTAELPESVRALAARLMTLTAHTMRIEQKVDTNTKALSEQIATLTDIIQALAQPQGAPAPAAPAPVESSAPAPTPAVATNEAPAEEASEEEESEAAFFARAQQEAEAEVAAINAAAPVAEVTPLPARKAGGKK